MKMKAKATYILILTILLMFTLTANVYAVDETGTVNLQEIPNRLAEALGIPLFAGRLLTCAIFFFIFFLPIAVFSRRDPFLLCLIMGLPLMGVFVGVGWMEPWYVLVIALLIAALWSGKIKGWLS